MEGLYVQVSLDGQAMRLKHVADCPGTPLDLGVPWSHTVPIFTVQVSPDGQAMRFKHVADCPGTLLELEVPWPHTVLDLHGLKKSSRS